MSGLLAWSLVLFVGALILGLPLALFVVHIVRSFWVRLFALVALGTVAHIIVFLMLRSNPIVIYGAPAGTMTALFCCLFNFDKLRQPEPRVLGPAHTVEA
jgi:hypothetical protein